MAKQALAIIGYGDFTKLMIKHLSPHFDIVLSSRQSNVDKDGLNFSQVTLAEALSQAIIIPSIPSQTLEDFFTKNRELLNPNALIIDVCSVKVRPVEVLSRVLPRSVEYLATHPMFGPASARDSLNGKKIMLYPVRINSAKYQKIKDFLSQTLKLHIIECAPEEHDQMMAYAQGLSHYIGRLMQTMNIPSSELTTDAYNDLLDMKRIQGGDSWDLFKSIMQDNPYALEINREFKQAIKQLDKKLGLA